MMDEYKRAYDGLNKAQLEAVRAIEGPVLVIAGPGTGKTQLISTRAGYILKNTDTPPEGILLLTFTEAGVQAMRERLQKLIGQAAYDINLSTYHAFGGEIIRRYPDYFEDAELTLIDELGVDTMLRGMVAKLPYSNPLKFADSYLGDVKTFISDAKRGLLSPEDITKVAQANLAFIAEFNKNNINAFAQLARVSKKSVPVFEQLLTSLKRGGGKSPAADVLALGHYAREELQTALGHFSASGKTTNLSEWKKRWLAKDVTGVFIFDGKRQNERLKAGAELYSAYQATLKAEHLYDYNDMILRAIAALEKNPEFKYSLAEQYSYIMLDEFQDTNPAQMRLVELLSDHPVHEGRPNILAVGDDDQAIYAFQGADHANMAGFAKFYKGVKVISLKENYRAHAELLEVGRGIAEQIGQRLHSQFDNVQKVLIAANKELPEPPLIKATEFKSDAAQYEWVAAEIKKIAKQGVPLSEVVILAPKHRYLLPVLPYLAANHLPVRYERRENILDEPATRQLEQMSRLVVALADEDEALANSLWPEVLSYDFWGISTAKIWQTSWQAKQTRTPWTAALLNDPSLSQVASFFLRLKDLLPLTTLEQQLDGLMGVAETSQKLKLPTISPFFEYYFGENSKQDSLDFANLVSNLNVLRAALRNRRRGQEEPIGLRALVDFMEGHRAAHLSILNTSPYHEAADAVNLLTAYGAKGREFRAVFIIAALDEVWGSSSRGAGYRLSLPANLSYIRYQGASEDERLRLLFVAATRARTRLYLTSYRQTLAGKSTDRLKYLAINEDDKGDLNSAVLPKPFAGITQNEAESLSLEAARSYWSDRHCPPFKPSLKTILAPKLERYQLSATDLNQFLDVIDAGPEAFFLRSILGFSSAPSLTATYGTAMHASLRWAGTSLTSEGELPKEKRLLDIFTAQLLRADLLVEDYDNLLARGRASLHQWLAQATAGMQSSDIYEYDFAGEGVFCGQAHLSGKIDRLIINQKTRTITVLDYKTGQSYRRWEPSVVKLHKFQQQLIFYKLLVEGSNRFKGYKVERGIIEFVEPDETGQINRLELPYDEQQLETLSNLIKAVWEHIQTLNFPPIDHLPKTVSGIKKFEADLAGQ